MFFKYTVFFRNGVALNLSKLLDFSKLLMLLMVLWAVFVQGSSAQLDSEFKFFSVKERQHVVPNNIPSNAKTVRPGFSWKGKDDWAWFVAALTIPEKIDGVSTEGKAIGIRISCAGGGAVYINGMIRTRYDNDKPALVLVTESATKGGRFSLAIQADTKGGGEMKKFSEAQWVTISSERACSPVVFKVDIKNTGDSVPNGIIGLSQGGCMCDYEDATALMLRRGGFKWFRMDNVLTNCLKEKLVDGKLVFDFTDLDRRIDFIYKIGAVPIIAASYMPQVLDAIPDNERHSAPRDYKLWEHLCYRVAKHCIERGRRVPYWEVWNEPNTGWIKPGPGDTGSKQFKKLYQEALADPAVSDGVVRIFEAYCKLYAATARGVRRADPKAKIGGPALASGPFENKERGHCFNGKGFARGLMLWCSREKLPLDFLSWHEYFQPPEVFRAEAAAFRSFLDDFPVLKNSVKSYMITEWNEAWWADPPQDNELGAAWCANTVTRAFIPARINMPCFFYPKQGDMNFRGDYSLLMRGNIPKPQFHVARIFNSLKGRWINVNGKDGEVSCVASWDGNTKRLSVVLVNHVDRYNLRRHVRLYVEFGGVPAIRLKEYRVDVTHSNVYYDTSKSALSMINDKVIKMPVKIYETILPPHSVSLIEVAGQQ